MEKNSTLLVPEKSPNRNFLPNLQKASSLEHKYNINLLPPKSSGQFTAKALLTPQQKQRTPEKARFTPQSLLRSQITLPVLEMQNSEKQKKIMRITTFRGKSKKIQEPFEDRLRVYKSLPNLHEKLFSIKWSSVSIPGSTSGNKKKINQDSYAEVQDFIDKNTYLFGVMDGHGNSGHLVSSFISENLPKTLQRNLQKRNLNGDAFRGFSNKEDLPQLRFSIRSSFLQTHNELLAQKTFDCVFSGSTSAFIMIDKEACICANVGDSRAVIGIQTKDEWKVSALSKDHKPENLTERQRIENSGGVIEKIKDYRGNYVGPDRVWISGERLPGLAMTRSMGDSIGNCAGIIAEPEISYTPLQPCNQIIILATDGLWEFVTSEEAVFLSSKYWGNPQGAVNELSKIATDRWNRNEPTVDDITIIVVFVTFSS